MAVDVISSVISRHSNSLPMCTPSSSTAPRVVLVTGATDGIGLELTRLLHQRRDVSRVLGLGSRSLQQAQQIDPLLFTDSSYIQLDLASPQCVAELQGQLEALQVTAISDVVHNAAAGWLGDPADQSVDSVDYLLAVNLSAPLQLTRGLLPWLAAFPGRRAIMMVSSIGVYLPTPAYTVYTATKTALDEFAASLATELSEHNVAVMVARPGPTQTSMHHRIGMSAAQQRGFAKASSVAAEMMAMLLRRRSIRVNIGAKGKAIAAAVMLGNAPIEAVMRRVYRSQFLSRASAGQDGDFDANADAIVWQASLLLPPLPQPVAVNANGTPAVLVTGAAQGIGQSLAQEYRRRGFWIIGVDIAWTAEASSSVDLAITADLSDDQTLRHVVAQARQACCAPLAMLVHNAGINVTKRFVCLPPDVLQRILSVNLRAPIVMTLLLQQAGLVRRPDTRIVLVSSLSRFVGYPGSATYAASKAGIAAYSRCMRAAGFATLTVYPGPTRTQQAWDNSPDNSRADARMHPDTVARIIVAASERKAQRRVVPGLGNKTVSLASLVFPSLFRNVVMRRLILNKLPPAPSSCANAPAADVASS